MARCIFGARWWAGVGGAGCGSGDYGSAEVFDEGVIRSDYAGVGEYYRVANLRRPGICPGRYAFAVGPGVSGTVESYLGPTLRLGRSRRRRRMRWGGDRAGVPECCRRAMRLVRGGASWSGRRRGCAGGSRGRWRRLRRTRSGAGARGWRGWGRRASTLMRAALRRLEGVLARREGYALVPALVNSDITPENLIVRRGRFVGLVDLVPHIGNATRHAALFLCCYRLLLPSLHDAPRYAGRGFGEHAGTMAHIADGYEVGYLETGPLRSRERWRTSAGCRC
ncbi:MAG: hypothetical protein U0232_28515 [Thermomicrobiales bacterium]